MRPLIKSNISDRFGAYAGLAVMLSIMFFVTQYLLGGLLPLWHIDLAYRRMGLENAVSVTAEAGQGDLIENYCQKTGGKYLGASFIGKYTADGFAFIQPVERDYFDNLNYRIKTRKSPETGYSAVVVSSLGGYYELGQTYSETLTGREAASIEFTVVGVLSDDCVYITPAADTPSSVVSEQENYIFIIVDESDENFSRRNLYGALGNDEFISRLNNFEDIQHADRTSGFEENRSLRLEISGLMIVLAITSAALCAAGIMSNSLLSMAQFRRKYAILFTLGATRLKCAAIQLLTDVIPHLCAIAVYLMLTILLKEFNILKTTPESAAIGLLEMFLIFAFSEVLAFLAAKQMPKISAEEEENAHT